MWIWQPTSYDVLKSTQNVGHPYDFMLSKEFYIITKIWGDYSLVIKEYYFIFTHFNVWSYSFVLVFSVYGKELLILQIPLTLSEKNVVKL